MPGDVGRGVLVLLTRRTGFTSDMIGGVGRRVDVDLVGWTD